MVQAKIKNYRGWVKKFLSIFVLGLFLQSPIALAEEMTENLENTQKQDVLYEPIQKQIIQLTGEGELEDWNVSELETFGLKFLIRAKEALTWSLNINDGGFHNSAIEKTYATVLTIVNSLFILGLLVIAAMWMFSILVPRKYLKKVMLVYGLAVVFVNFALPVNQLFIDGTNLLQKTLLIGKEGNIEITDIVQTPSYEKAIGYKNQGADSLIDNGDEEVSLTLKANQGSDRIELGTIESLGEEGKTESISLKAQEIKLSKKDSVYLNQEQTVFRFLMIGLTAIAYFIIALVFIARIVMLWALLILSPILLVLAIFKSTRGWFYNWLSMYGRWLLIGPLTALGIAIIVNIWQLSGLPITVNEGYTPEVFASIKSSNIAFYLPGKDTVNTLSNTGEMMEYLIFLLMLYLPIVLAFTLTRRSNLKAVASTTVKTILQKETHGEGQTLQVNPMMWDEKERNKPEGIMNTVKNLVNEKIIKIAGKTMPLDRLKSEGVKPNGIMPTASNFLKENLEKIPVVKMLELLGQEKGSKTSHTQVIEKLAHPESIENKTEREQATRVLESIQTKSEAGDHQAAIVMQEIQRANNNDSIDQESANVEVIVQTSNTTIEASETKSEDQTGSINIHVNDKTPEADKKIQDKSFQKETEKNTQEIKAEEKKVDQKKQEEKKDDAEKKQDPRDSDQNRAESNDQQEAENKKLEKSQTPDEL